MASPEGVRGLDLCLVEVVLGGGALEHHNVEARECLNSPISVVNLAQKDIGNGKKGFANASDSLETWDDSDIITAVNAQKDLRHPTKWWHNHSTSQYKGSEANYEHTEVVGTELRLETNNPISLRISNT